ncbi:MAG: hypothetical protein KF716_21880 [Anaerolineae bacterium]|nr:hypothetical protein [Anaerolineae bacterium]
MLSASYSAGTRKRRLGSVSGVAERGSLDHASNMIPCGNRDGMVVRDSGSHDPKFDPMWRIGRGGLS